MIRISFVLGTWQLIVLVSALRSVSTQLGYACGDISDYLVIYGPDETTSLRQNLDQLATGIWPWRRIIQAGKLLNTKIEVEEIDLLKEQIVNRIGLLDADELWLCKLSDTPEKLVADCYPTANIVLYEDGLHTYAPQQVILDTWKSSRLHPKQFIKRIVQSLSHKPQSQSFIVQIGIAQSQVDRLTSMYLPLASQLDLPEPIKGKPLYTISDGLILETIRECRAITGRLDSNITSSGNSASRVLVLGQCFARWGLMTRDAEFSIYANILSSLVEHGYYILWKDHPRIDEPFFDMLSRMIGPSIQQVNIDKSLPIELVAEHLELTACVAATSTALFYLPRLFGIQVYSFAAEIIPFVSGDFKYLAQLVMAHIPSVPHQRQ